MKLRNRLETDSLEDLKYDCTKLFFEAIRPFISRNNITQNAFRIGYTRVSDEYISEICSYIGCRMKMESIERENKNKLDNAKKRYNALLKETFQCCKKCLQYQE